ncbi:hypothetical protein GCM10023116_19570 [Kistimonas scapharcae]|uniref:Uncharacterized protein n=1 Tax=Kistimonas scapharcae TaxID=1036133 RepID=A0ABP8V0G2_9GAMM
MIKNPVVRDLLDRAVKPEPGQPVPDGGVVIVLGGASAHGDFSNYRVMDGTGELVKSGEFCPDPEDRQEVIAKSFTPDEYDQYTASLKLEPVTFEELLAMADEKGKQMATMHRQEILNLLNLDCSQIDGIDLFEEHIKQIIDIEIPHWQNDGTNFTSLLLTLIQKADPANLYKIQLGFPAEVEAFKRWEAKRWESVEEDQPV